MSSLKRGRGRGVQADGRSKRSNKFVMITENIQRSPAWRDLSTVARCLWIELERRYKGEQVANVVSLSCREAASLLNVSKDTAARAFLALESHGFIREVVPGGFDWQRANLGSRATRWRLTHQLCQEKPPTNEWRNWRPSQPDLECGRTRRTDLSAQRDAKLARGYKMSQEQDANSDSPSSSVASEGQSVESAMPETLVSVLGICLRHAVRPGCDMLVLAMLADLQTRTARAPIHHRGAEQLEDASGNSS